MIILFGGAEIAVMLIAVVAIVAGSAEAIINMTNFFIMLFVAKNIIQTIILGHFVNKNPFSYTVGFVVTDIIRMAIFFTNLRSVGVTFVQSVGLNYFAALFGFILYFVICGSVFLLGEFISLLQSLGNKQSSRGSNQIALCGGIGTVIVLAIVTWVGYL